MKDQRKTDIKVGLTVLIGVIILLYIFGWAKNLTLNSDRKVLKVEFQSVAGLEIGDQVAVNGVRKGYVKDISINKNKVITELDLDSDIELSDDAEFSVMMLDLMGGKKIEINPGVSLNKINYDIVHEGRTLGDIASAMAVFGNVQGDLIDVVKEVKISLGHLNKIMSDKEFESDLKISVSNLKELTENLNTVVIKNQDEINRLLKSGTQLSESVNSFMEENKDSIKITISTLKATLDHSKDLIVNMNEFLSKVENGENNLGKALNDKKLLEDLKTSITNLKEISILLLDQLQKEGIKVDTNIF